jgi:multiple sugar transport system permease protein
MNRQARVGVAFTAPVLAAVLGFFVTPVVAAFALSLTDFDIYALADMRALRFTGLDTFADLLRQPLFWRALGNTLLFAGVGVPLAVSASLGAALLLAQPAVRGKAVWRVLLFAPYVSTLVAAAVVWRYLFGTRFGLINAGLRLLHLPPVDWLGDTHWAIPAILIFATWKVFPYNMVVFTAALSAVPKELDEAARLDGAGPWSRLRHVIIPAIGPVLALAALLSVAGFLQIFDEPYVMTQGGPAQSTTTLVYLMFNQGFEWWSLGRASAIAMVLFALTLAVTGLQARAGRRRGWL